MPPDALPSCLKPQATVVSFGCPEMPGNVPVTPQTVTDPSVSQVSASVVSTGAAGGVVISPSPSPSCLSAASSIDNLTTPLGELAVGGAAGSVDVTSVSDRKEGEGTDVRCEFWGRGLPLRTCPFLLAAQNLPNDLTVRAALLDMTINQFLKSLGLEHLRDIFQREQVINSRSHRPPRVGGASQRWPADLSSRECLNGVAFFGFRGRSRWTCWQTWVTKS